MRQDGRNADQLRPFYFETDYIAYPEGSVLAVVGGTKVLCNVTIQDGVPRWMQNEDVTGGWVTGEYAMLPRATIQRTPRENFGLRGRTQEIKRLIGRSLRAGIDLEKLGPRTCIVDCDVLQADGGTRTAAITGGFLALAIALKRLIINGEIPKETIRTNIAAVSVGIVNDQPLLDLCYLEDRQAEVDANVVMTSKSDYVEVQFSAEKKAFPRSKLTQLLDLAVIGIDKLIAAQQNILDKEV